MQLMSWQCVLLAFQMVEISFYFPQIKLKKICLFSYEFPLFNQIFLHHPFFIDALTFHWNLLECLPEIHGESQVVNTYSKRIPPLYSSYFKRQSLIVNTPLKLYICIKIIKRKPAVSWNHWHHSLWNRVFLVAQFPTQAELSVGMFVMQRLNKPAAACWLLRLLLWCCCMS